MKTQPMMTSDSILEECAIVVRYTKNNLPLTKKLTTLLRDRDIDDVTLGKIERMFTKTELSNNYTILSVTPTNNYSYKIKI
jgi:hypothetical protein